MNKLPCEVVRDLLPSYIDELTSTVTNNLIEEHTTECAECHQVLVSMKNPEVNPMDDKSKKEIDFLKKTRKKHKKDIRIGIVGAIVSVMLFFLVRSYFFGTVVENEYVACQVEVNGKVLSAKCAVTDYRLEVSNLKFAEEDGVVTIICETVRRSPLFDKSIEGTYTAGQDIIEVRLGDRILWAKGKNISAETSAVYQTKHPYVGDMAANNYTSNALNMEGTLGRFKNQLQTTAEPYGWHFLMEQEITNLPISERYMKSYGYVLLAVIGNLGEVTYEYNHDGVPMVMTITKEEATDFAGENIKSVGEDIVSLQYLMKKAGLIDMSYIADSRGENIGEGIIVEIVNLTKDDISSMAINYYVNEDSMITKGTTYADGSLLKKGDVVCFELLPEDFENGQWKKGDNILFDINVTKENGETYVCGEKVPLSMEFGYRYMYLLTDDKDGYHISQQ